MRRVRGTSSSAAIVAVLLATACGGPATGTPAPPPNGSAAALAASPSAPAQAAPSGIASISYEQAGDPGAAAKQELQLTKDVRAEAGMPALIGAQGPAAFTTLDSIESTTAQGWLATLAPAIDAGQIPHALAGPLTGQLASVDQPAPGGAAPSADSIDLSLYAETGFTTSALMGMFAAVIDNAGQSFEGTLPSQETKEQVADGLRQHVDMHLTYVLHTGAGKVSLDILMSATDTITDAASGTFVALYTSTSTGHFDVSACPDTEGVAAGTYTFETKHELNDVSGAANSQSAGGRTVDAPFRLIDNDTAKLVRIEANLDLGASARGPGTPGGPGPTAAFDWTARQTVPIVIPASGGFSTGAGQPMTVTGTGGAAADGSMFVSSAMTQLFLSEVGKAAEKFWRSGKCIDLTPSDDTRSVDPDQEIDLTVQAKEAFGGNEIKKPIKAKFTGAKSISPANQPIDEPATFHFIAGHEKDEKGTIDLEQVSNRGIGMRQVVYTVQSKKLTAEVQGTQQVAAGPITYDTTFHLSPIPLAPGEAGTSKGSGTVQWTTTVTVPGCKTKTYEGTFGTEVIATLDTTDPNSVHVRWSFEPGQLHNETLVCSGRSFPFTGSTSLGGWLIAGLNDNTVRIDGSADVTTTLPTGTQKLTITIKRA